MRPTRAPKRHVHGRPRQVSGLVRKMAIDVERNHRRMVAEMVLDGHDRLPALDEQTGVEVPELVERFPLGESKWKLSWQSHPIDGDPVSFVTTRRDLAKPHPLCSGTALAGSEYCWKKFHMDSLASTRTMPRPTPPRIQLLAGPVLSVLPGQTCPEPVNRHSATSESERQCVYVNNVAVSPAEIE
jgi:hypothetical protein